jgi:hypothetical protein
MHCTLVSRAKHGCHRNVSMPFRKPLSDKYVFLGPILKCSGSSGDRQGVAEQGVQNQSVKRGWRSLNIGEATRNTQDNS